MLGSFSTQYRKLTWTMKSCNIQNIFILRTLAACFCCYYFNIFTTKFKEDIRRNFFFFVKCRLFFFCVSGERFSQRLISEKIIFACIYFRSCLKFNNFACIIFTGGKVQTFLRYLFIDFLWVIFQFQNLHVFFYSVN